jgi:hypothetical protein
MNKELLKLLLDSLERLVLAYLKYEGKLKPAPTPVPVPVPNVPEDPDEVVPDVVDDVQVPGQPKASTSNAKLYVPRADRQRWIDSLDNAYSVWRGEREYAAILANAEVAFPYIKHIYTMGGIRTLARWAAESNAKSNRLQHRINKEIHRKFRDRSQVRKSVVNEMKAELEKRTAEYNEVAAAFPHVKGCDSIKCKLESGKLRRK